MAEAPENDPNNNKGIPDRLLENDVPRGLFASKSKLIIGSVVLIGALVYFAFLAFQSATVYYYTVGELNALGPTAEGKVVRVSGKLTHGSFFREEAHPDELVSVILPWDIFAEAGNI